MQMSTLGRRSRRITAAVALCAAVVAGGCGSVHSDRELAAREYGLAAAAPASPGVTVPGQAPSAAPETSPAALAASAPAATPGATSTPQRGSGSTAQAGSPQPAGASAAPQTPSAAPRPAAAGATAAPGSSKTPSAAVAPSPAPSAPVAGGAKPEIVLGSIGTESGVIGQILQDIPRGAKMWAADANARGGLNGHPVRVILGDDGGDPNRALALAKRMVDQDKVIAFYADHGPGSYQAVMPFLEQRKVPLLSAGCACSAFVAHSPMGFAVGTGADEGMTWSHALPLIALSDKRKVSMMYCAEVASCRNIRDGVVKNAGRMGIQIVHEAQVSLSQPDFSAELLAARNAGADALIMAIDVYSVIRVKRSADRQDYHPAMSFQYEGHSERFIEQGGKDVDGILIGAQFPHWTSPKLADYREAVARFGQGLAKGSETTTTYQAGKLLELVSKNWPANPTSQDVINSLYTLNGETLGGIMPPLTFIPGKGSDIPCIVPVKIENGKFVPKDGDNYTCAPGWQPPRK